MGIPQVVVSTWIWGVPIGVLVIPKSFIEFLAPNGRDLAWGDRLARMPLRATCFSSVADGAISTLTTCRRNASHCRLNMMNMVRTWHCVDVPSECDHGIIASRNVSMRTRSFWQCRGWCIKCQSHWMVEDGRALPLIVSSVFPCPNPRLWWIGTTNRLPSCVYWHKQGPLACFFSSFKTYTLHFHRSTSDVVLIKL